MRRRHDAGIAGGVGAEEDARRDDPRHRGEDVFAVVDEAGAEGRPQRLAIESLLRTQRAAPVVGAVARGWELAIKLVELGAGVAIVNACCRLPRGLVARPVRELPRVRYVTFTRPKPRGDAAELVRVLVRHADAWRRR